MKIGLFGGSFNPIHNTHTHIIKKALADSFVDEVWVLPCYSHNFGKFLLDFDKRVEMIKLALKGIDNTKVITIEKQLGGKSRTYETLLKLKEENNNEFFLIMGSDLLDELGSWYNSKELLKEVSFIIYERDGYPVKNLSGIKIVGIVKDDPTVISSSEIRKRILDGKKISHLVGGEVESFILKNKLYK